MHLQSDCIGCVSVPQRKRHAADGLVFHSLPRDTTMRHATQLLMAHAMVTHSILAKVETSIAALEQVPQNTFSITAVLDKVREANNLLKEIQSQLVG